MALAALLFPPPGRCTHTTIFYLLALCVASGWPPSPPGGHVFWWCHVCFFPPTGQLPRSFMLGALLRIWGVFLLGGPCWVILVLAPRTVLSGAGQVLVYVLFAIVLCIAHCTFHCRVHCMFVGICTFCCFVHCTLYLLL